MTLSLLFVFYSACVVYYMSQSRFFKNSGLSPLFLQLAFASKLGAGLLYGFLHHVYFEGGDTFLYLEESVQLAQSFLQAPSYYPFGHLLGASLPDIETPYIYPPGHDFLRNLGTYSLIHVHAFLQLFTFGYYPLHIVFVALVGMFASVSLYRSLDSYRLASPWALRLVLFFMPSVLFWTSGLHKEIFIYAALASIIRFLVLYEQGRRNWFALLFGMALLLLFRHYLAALIALALLAFFSADRTKSSLFWHYSKVYSMSLILFIALDSSVFDSAFLQILSGKQAAFLAEYGGSVIAGSEALGPNYLSWLAFIPEALINVSCRPFLWHCRDILQVLAALEVLFIWLLFLWAWYKGKPGAKLDALSSFLLFFALSNLVLVGFLVANVGTIVRYRALGLGLFVLVLSPVLDSMRKQWILWRSAGAAPPSLGKPRENKRLVSEQSELL